MSEFTSSAVNTPNERPASATFNVDSFAQVCQQYDIRYISTPTFLLLAVDVGRALGVKNIRDKFRLLDPSARIIRNVETSGGRQPCTYLTIEGVKTVICQSRKPAARMLAASFGIQVTENHFVMVEPAVVTFLTKAFAGEVFVPQYRVGAYMIDLYIPRVLVAIEVDEERTHGASQRSRDMERQLYIETAIPGCRFIRCRPQAPDFCMATLVNKVWEALKSS